MGELITYAPQSLQEAMQYSELLAQSDIIPKNYKGKAGDILVAIQWGAEIGLSPLQALQNIATINGRASLWGDSVLALVQGSGKLEYIHETVENGIATCRVKRINQPEHVSTFGEEDAKMAGLLGKQGPWTQYPKRMMQMRARSFALRDQFADVLKGISVAEEVQDMPDSSNVITPDEPKQIGAPKVDEPYYKQVGNAILDHFGSAKAMKEFVAETLQMTDLKGKFMESLSDDQLTTLETRLMEVMQGGDS